MADQPRPISVRVADDRDLPVLARLRRQWAAERSGSPETDVDGPDLAFERTFEAWWRAELPRRTFWLAEAGTDRTGYTAVGSLNVVEIGNMPRPGGRPGRWGYVANAFVVAAYADRGVAAALLGAAVELARDRRYQRLVLRPTSTSAPFYLRYGFQPAGDGMLSMAPAAGRAPAAGGVPAPAECPRPAERPRPGTGGTADGERTRAWSRPQPGAADHRQGPAAVRQARPAEVRVTP